jgi:hypothetical protein
MPKERGKQEQNLTKNVPIPSRKISGTSKKLI